MLTGRERCWPEDDDERAIARFRVAYAWLLLRCAPPREEQAYEMLLTAHDSLKDCGSEVDLAYCETELGRAKLLLDEPKGGARAGSGAFCGALGRIFATRARSPRIIIARAAATR